ncbi:hypothetical protein CDAR_255831 [Caerostris darwini]|uniref:Uncharacterized protein n=1 Tax=Caerostris darwini TaxID=1538125 RepID=A0AAV4VE11_9ARAC|nr:hypothetical protein CDAR_255831 [Caerostris darwini]
MTSGSLPMMLAEIIHQQTIEEKEYFGIPKNLFGELHNKTSTVGNHYHSGDVLLTFPPSEELFRRRRKSGPKTCRIIVQKTEMQEGTCTRLADNTPACNNEHYLAINYNEC